jgi:hypothetical protein
VQESTILKEKREILKEKMRAKYRSRCTDEVEVIPMNEKDDILDYVKSAARLDISAAHINR